MLYVGSEPEYQLMHNTQGAGAPACSADSLQTDQRDGRTWCRSILQFTA